MRRTGAAAASLVLALGGGCSGDDAPKDTAESAAQAQEGGEGLPEELLGTFADGTEAYFTFYGPGEDFCESVAETDGSCYAVRDSADVAADPIEHGSASADGAVVRLTVVQDPNAQCIGVTNELRWERTADTLTLTPVKDCHGPRPLTLSAE